VHCEHAGLSVMKVRNPYSRVMSIALRFFVKTNRTFAKCPHAPSALHINEPR
jgi:hypothetical protein